MFIVGADNVGSKQMQQIRASLRDKGVVLMGKNTTIRKVIRAVMEKNPQLEKLLPHVKGNVGFVFTDEDLKDIRDVIESNKVSVVTGILSVLADDDSNGQVVAEFLVRNSSITSCCLPADASHDSCLCDLGCCARLKLFLSLRWPPQPRLGPWHPSTCLWNLSTQVWAQKRRLFSRPCRSLPRSPGAPLRSWSVSLHLSLIASGGKATSLSPISSLSLPAEQGSPHQEG